MTKRPSHGHRRASGRLRSFRCNRREASIGPGRVRATRHTIRERPANRIDRWRRSIESQGRRLPATPREIQPVLRDDRLLPVSHTIHPGTTSDSRTAVDRQEPDPRLARLETEEAPAVGGLVDDRVARLADLPAAASIGMDPPHLPSPGSIDLVVEVVPLPRPHRENLRSALQQPAGDLRLESPSHRSRRVHPHCTNRRSASRPGTIADASSASPDDP